MPGILNKVLNFVGWETDFDDETEEENRGENEVKEIRKGTYPVFGEKPAKEIQENRKPRNKVVNLNAQALMRVVVLHPEKFDEALEICDHLKDARTIVVNLETVDKDTAQRIVDFLSGSVYALDGNIQKVAAAIFLIAPQNVDIMGDFKDELRNKGSFPWLK